MGDKLKLVYIIENKSTNLIKIGVTDNIKRRLRQLECSSGVKLKLIYKTNFTKHYKIIEKSLHKYFNLKRKEGEYFYISPELAKEKLLFVLENIEKIYN